MSDSGACACKTTGTLSQRPTALAVQARLRDALNENAQTRPDVSCEKMEGLCQFVFAGVPAPVPAVVPGPAALQTLGSALGRSWSKSRVIQPRSAGLTRWPSSTASRDLSRFSSCPQPLTQAKSLRFTRPNPRVTPNATALWRCRTHALHQCHHPHAQRDR
jgi:hypothetical protein